jgi:hypothetical protein
MPDMVWEQNVHGLLVESVDGLKHFLPLEKLTSPVTSKPKSRNPSFNDLVATLCKSSRVKFASSLHNETHVLWTFSTVS